jgi:hypothetical protein
MQEDNRRARSRQATRAVTLGSLGLTTMTFDHEVEGPGMVMTPTTEVGLLFFCCGADQ